MTLIFSIFEIGSGLMLGDVTGIFSELGHLHALDVDDFLNTFPFCI